MAMAVLSHTLKKTEKQLCFGVLRLALLPYALKVCLTGSRHVVPPLNCNCATTLKLCCGVFLRGLQLLR